MIVLSDKLLFEASIKTLQIISPINLNSFSPKPLVVPALEKV